MAIGFGSFKPAGKEETPDFATAVAMDARFEQEAQARADALRAQQIQGAANIGAFGYENRDAINEMAGGDPMFGYDEAAIVDQQAADAGMTGGDQFQGAEIVPEELVGENPALAPEMTDLGMDINAAVDANTALDTATTATDALDTATTATDALDVAGDTLGTAAPYVKMGMAAASGEPEQVAQAALETAMMSNPYTAAALMAWKVGDTFIS